jgi:hypothetical protein
MRSSLIATFADRRHPTTRPRILAIAARLSPDLTPQMTRPSGGREDERKRRDIVKALSAWSGEGDDRGGAAPFEQDLEHDPFKMNRIML